MSGEKTEEPTDKHLRDAREQGQVAKSQEIPSTAVVLSVVAFVWIGFDWIAGRFQALFLDAASLIGQPFGQAFPFLIEAAAETFLIVVVPCVVMAAVAGSVGHLAQTGLVLAWKAAMPSLDKLNPKQWFSKVFSIKNLIEFLRSIVKIGVVTVVFYMVFMDALPLLLRLPGHGLDAAQVAMRMVMRETVFYLFACLAAICAADWFFQRQQFLKEHMMSKEDVKNEYKEMEGDPQIKGQRKQLHQELVMGDQVASVKKADVLITNPTHLAIAIEYKPDKTPLPVILAKGRGELAARMVREAEKAGVPVMRNVPLAHDLYEQGQELHYIPETLIEPVAEVLIWLRELREKEGGG